MSKEAEAAEPVIEADQNHSAFRKLAAVIDCRRTAAIDPAAAVNPEHHRELLSLGFLGRPDIQNKAILCGSRPEWRGVARERQLHAIVAIARRSEGRGPLCRGLRGAPTESSDRWGRVRNSLIGDDSVSGRAFHRAGFCVGRLRLQYSRQYEGRDREENADTLDRP